MVFHVITIFPEFFNGPLDHGIVSRAKTKGLIGIEFQEERVRVFKLFLLASISLILGLLILVGLSAAVVILFWDTHPIAAILVLCLLYAIGMIVCVSRAARLAKESASPYRKR